jgi:hypothetical protein
LATYRKGQEADWLVSREYCEAAKAAVLKVAEIEGVAVTGEEQELKLYDKLAEEADIRAEAEQRSQ